MIENDYYKTKAGFKKAYIDYCVSGLSIKNFCKQNKIPRVTFYKYKKIQ
jgi:hypothetical protein